MMRVNAFIISQSQNSLIQRLLFQKHPNQFDRNFRSAQPINMINFLVCLQFLYMIVKISKIFNNKTLTRCKSSLYKSFLAPFSSNNKEKDQKQTTQPKRVDKVSVADLWQWGTQFGEEKYRELKKVNYKWWAAFASLGLLYAFTHEAQAEEYAINYFQSQIAQNSSAFNELNVRVKVSESSPQYQVYFQKDSKKYYVNFNSNYQRLMRNINKCHSGCLVTYQYKTNYEIKLSVPQIIANLLAVFVLGAFFSKSGSMTSGVKNSNSKLYQQLLGSKKGFEVITKTNVKFADVAGLDQSKVEVMEFVDFLKNPEKYRKLGARIPKGVLLSGPPGTGKTMLAKACAGEAGVPFIPCSGSDFVEIFVGVGASRVRQLFAAAREKSPSIIFIDEIDAVGRKRSGSHGSHDERDNTLNQILVQMDGFDTDSHVIVMAATNRQNLLDTALIRPGRFDRIVEVNLPDLQGRRQIFNVHLKKIVLQQSKTIDQYARRLASLTPGFSGADIANLCNEAALLAARNNKQMVDSNDFQMATQRQIGGIEKRGIVSTQQKKIVAIHQSGHAVVSWFLQGADPLLKLTIIPRSKGSLGFAQYFSNQNKLSTKNQLIDQICFILGGRCAEQHFYGTCTNGAADDLDKAYRIAFNIVTKLGMNDRIGNIGFKNGEYLRPYSDEMGSKIDTQIMTLLKQCTKRTKQMVKKHDHLIKKLSNQLFEKETLTIRQIRNILGEREFSNHDAYNSYLEVQKQQLQKQLQKQSQKKAQSS